MISVKVLAKHLERFAVDNMPVILTAVAATGAVGTAILSARGAFAASEHIDDERERRVMYSEPDLDKKATVLLVWTDFLPAAGVCAVTVGSVFFANRISTKRAMALAAAYSMSERNLAEYKDKAREKLGLAKSTKVEDEIAQDRVTAKPPQDAQVIITGSGDVMVYDMPSDRYFRSDAEKIRRIVNDINAQVNETGVATLNDFYVALHLNPTDLSDRVGWDRGSLLNLTITTTLTDKSEPCLAINYTYGVLGGDKSDPPF